MADLWFKMDSAHGHLWDDGGGVGAEKFQDWLDETSHLAIEKLEHGLEALRDRDNHFPPTLPEFRALCNSIPKRRRTDEDVEREALTLAAQQAVDSTDFRVHTGVHPQPRRGRSKLVMRIETAKQKALLGSLRPDVPVRSGHRDDWTLADQHELERLTATWDRETGHRGLCDLLDDVQFSRGSLNSTLGLPPGTRNAGIPIN